MLYTGLEVTFQAIFRFNMSARVRAVITVMAMVLWQVAKPAPTLKAPWGTIEGVDIFGQKGKNISGYLGIPYAVPPLGALRWQKAKPHPGLVGDAVFHADKLKPACPQELPGLGVYSGTSEDCLTLNVFVPADGITTKSFLPVMVWIHGGGFIYGDAPTYRPVRLVADGGVIVVTIQYRLGVFGFLHYELEGKMLGNFGLWDQNLALQWVKDNIVAFGGDPNLITFFGQSAGSISVGMHMMSHHSRGLFRRAILQSGSPLIVRSMNANTKKDNSDLRALGLALDCQADSDFEIVQCLQSCYADDVINKSMGLLKQRTVIFYPVVDGDFFPHDLNSLMQDEGYAQSNGIGDLDIMMGFTNKEGALLLLGLEVFGGTVESATNSASFPFFLENVMKFTSQGKGAEVTTKVVEFFYRGADAGSMKPVSIDVPVDLLGDVIFNAPGIQTIQSLAAQPRSGALYLYLFDHDVTSNKGRLVEGSHHGDELYFVFDLLFPEVSTPYLNKSKIISKEEEPLFEMFVKILTEFAKTGNPNPPLVGVLENGWPQFTNENQAYLSLSLTPSVQREIFRDRMALWLQLVPQLNDAIEKLIKEPPIAEPVTREEL